MTSSMLLVILILETPWQRSDKGNSSRIQQKIVV